MKIPSNDDEAETLHALFPTLVYHYRLDAEKFRTAFSAAIDDAGFVPEQSGSRHNAGEYHGRIFLHRLPALQDFFKRLSDRVAAYLAVLGMQPDLYDMHCLKSWFTICEPDESGDETAMVAHNHSCSDISWVYYADVPDDCPPITFHAGRRLATEPFGSAFHDDWHQSEKSAIRTVNWWNSNTWSVHPRAGDLLLFPGHQLHSVEANHTNSRRISVAGDIALTLRRPHTALEFGRTCPEHWLSLPVQRHPDS